MESGAAFILGLLGSLHCIFMCGPLALALPVGKRSMPGKIFAYIQFNSGRIISYMLLGAIVGNIGKVFKLAGLQQIFSVTAGALIICIVIFKYFISAGNLNFAIAGGMSNAVRKLFSKYFLKEFPGKFMILGMMNGYLPCGLLYIALIAASTGNGMLESATFMGFFGLGTFPALFAVCLLGTAIDIKKNVYYKKLMPAGVFIIGLLFIIRGLNLGIPYLSPQIIDEQMSCCHKVNTTGHPIVKHN